MDSINHRLHRLLLSINLLEHIFEGLGCVNECYRSLFTTITKTRTSKQTHYICHVGEGLDSRTQKHALESDTFINVEIFNIVLLHDLFYTFIV